MSALHKQIVDMIRLNGPISIADYMSLCLSHPVHGYYSKNEAIGEDGDFITAPEVSQMFGELIGVWIVICWRALGRPDPVHLIEGGPGRGTLMADLLRAASVDSAFKKAVHVHLVDINPTLKAIQAETLLEEIRAGVSISWHNNLTGIESGPTIFVGNELIDAFAIRQFIFQRGQWCERMIGLDDQDHLQFGAMPVADTPDFLSPLDPQEGSLYEICPQGESFVSEIGRRVKSHGGAGLIIDYGYDDATLTGDSLQAMRKHEYDDPLKRPGDVDLTAHVDFATLKALLDRLGVSTMPISTQSEFLFRMGLLERAGSLGTDLGEDARNALQQDVYRLAAPDEMGTLFKVLGFSTLEGQILEGWEKPE